MYRVRKLKLGPSPQLEKLALQAGNLYSKVLVYFWRTVRKKRIWLSPNAMMKLFRADGLHSQSAQAVIQSFYASLKSWQKRRRVDPNAHPPRRRRKYFKIVWKSSAIRVKDGKLKLSNGRGNPPLKVRWPFDTPKIIELGWNGSEYELRATYLVEKSKTIGHGVAAIDLGEIHPFVVFDGQQTIIYNGRYLRSVRRYQNRLKAKLSQKLSALKKGSRRWKKLNNSKKKQLKKLNNQIKDILHKLSRHCVSTLFQRGVHTLVIGDVRNIRRNLNYGKKVNQKLHQWIFGQSRWQLSYKWELLGGEVKIQEEFYTSSICPLCGTKCHPNGRVFRCKCNFVFHRDGVGSINIRSKYLGYSPVVGEMAPPIGVRFNPHLCSLGKAA